MKTLRIILNCIIVVILTLLISCKTELEPHNLVWSQTFGGSGGDYAKSVQQTADGGYILAGGTDSYGAGNEDAWLLKTNAEGTERWSRTFGGSANDAVKSVQQTADGGYILAGKTESYGAGKYDAWLIKTDTMGIKQWSQTFGGSANDSVEFVQQTADGGYILTGKTWSSWEAVAWLIKTNAMGVEQWSRNFQWSQSLGDSYKDEIYSVQQTADGGYILAGRTWSFRLGFEAGNKSEAWLIKTNAEGIKQWNRTFGGSNSDWIKSVQQTADGGYILAGKTWSSWKGVAWLIKTNTMGVEQWSRNFQCSQSLGDYYKDEIYSVQQTTDGGYILAGKIESCGAGKYDAWLIKTDTMGIKQWSQTFGDSEDDVVKSVQQTADGGYILAGYTKSYGVGGSDAWLIKISH